MPPGQARPRPDLDLPPLGDLEGEACRDEGAAARRDLGRLGGGEVEAGIAGVGPRRERDVAEALDADRRGGQRRTLSFLNPLMIASNASTESNSR